MKRIVVLLTAGLLLAAGAAAQDSAPVERTRTLTLQEPPHGGENFFFQSDSGQQVEKAFFMAELTPGGELVTNAPYSATAVEENTQTLADGNRIVHKSSDFVARDSQGRMRRETTLNRIGSVQVDAPKMVFISDPTTHTQFILTPGDATKVVKGEGAWTSGPNIVELQTQNGERRKRVVDQKVTVTKTLGGPEASGESEKQVKNEDLGTQTIEGISAQGRRETVTIPAGQIGNDRPIEIVTEVWTSPDLHTVVLRKHSDPRVGETVFRLTNVNRSEPDPSLFQPPANSKVRVDRMIELKPKVLPKD